MRGKRVNLVGQTFGRLTVVERDTSKIGIDPNSWWICSCSCGTMKSILGAQLKAGETSSCGCYRKEFAKRRVDDGTSTIKRTHGQTKSPEHRSWGSMRQRCLNPQHHAYADYGGRGIKVCQRWDSFENFLVDMGPRPSLNHTLDRIDNNGDYTPENCRWATETQQKLNRRDNRYVTINGETKQLSVWSRESGIPFDVLSKRLNAGWAPEKAIAEPLRVFDRVISHGEVTQPVSKWAEQAQMPVETLLERLAKGWDFERVITQPYRRTKRSPFNTSR